MFVLTAGARSPYGVPPMTVHLLILNYNGRRLLPQCLPSVLEAAEQSRHRCEVVVIDNESTDDSIAWLRAHFPEVRIIGRPNRGLCSLNDVVGELPGPVAVLLNNDIKLAPDCVDPLVQPLLTGSHCFMTAPLCWRFDGITYEGFRTAVRWRWGLVQATALFPGHEATIRLPGPTASAGAAMAVDCRKFAELGGFDPLYLPGRLEDLDFCYRGYQAGYHALYVPDAVAYHRGMATFGPRYGVAGCDRLALRNTLLFQWKNLRHPLHVARQMIGLPLRLAWDFCRAAWVAGDRRWMFLRALIEAIGHQGWGRSTSHPATGTLRRQREFFRQFHPARMAAVTQPSAPEERPLADDHKPSAPQRRQSIARGVSPWREHRPHQLSPEGATEQTARTPC